MTGNTIASLTNLSAWTDDAFTRAIATCECRAAIGGLATSSIRARIRIALIYDTHGSRSRRIAGLTHCARRIARRDTNAIHAGLACRTHRAGTCRYAGEAHERIIGNASLISGTRISFAGIVHARTLIAGFVATLARHVETIVEHAFAHIRTTWSAHGTRAAGHAITRIAASCGTIALANRWLDASWQFGAGWCAEHGVVGVLDGLRRTIAAKSLEISRAIRHGQRIARLAAHDRFALLSRRTGEFTVIARSRALTAASTFYAYLALRAARICTVVDHAVAIVVGAIAFFDRRALTAETNEHAVFTGPCTLNADTLVFTTRLTNDRHWRRKRICRSIQAIRRIAHFIDRAITIVVEAVADFGIRTNAAHTNQSASAIALQDAWLTRRARSISRIKRGVIRWRAASTERNTVVDVAFAIVVKTIADLGRWRNVTYAIENTGRTGDDACLAFTRVRTTYAANASQCSVVHHAIAVVIKTVTRFWQRALRILTNPSSSSGTGQGAEITRCRQGTIAATCGSRRRTPRQSIERTTIARVVPATILTSWRRIRERSIVGRAVTVVIDAVTNFILRADSTLTNQ